MRTAVSEEQIAFYRREGYLPLDGFLDAAELQRWRGTVDAAVAARDGRSTPDPDRKGHSSYGGAFVQTINLWMDDPEVYGLVGDPGLGRMLCRLAGIDGIRIWHDQALCKQPHAGATNWHKDNQFWSFTDPASLSIWVALDDATVENGALWFFPGSHERTGTHRISCYFGGSTEQVFKDFPDYRPDAVCVPRRAGDAVVHNGWMVHGAGANHTAGWRRAMTCAYMPDGSVYNGQENILPARLTTTLREGDRLHDEAQNPLVWHRQRAAALPG